MIHQCSSHYDAKERDIVPKVVLLVVWQIGEECVVDIKDPGILAVATQHECFGQEQCRLIGSSLHVCLVLRRAHVLVHSVDTLARHLFELPDIVELHIELPALTVVPQAHAQVIPLPPKILQYVPGVASP